MHDDVDELIRRRTQVEIPAEVEDRLRRRLAEFRVRVEQRPPSRLRSFAYSLMSPPVLRPAAMTAVALAIVAAGLILVPRESRASQVFAAAANELKSAQSLQYTVVLNSDPYVGLDFAYLAPGYRRVNFSWGMEVRTDGATGRQILLMHGIHAYLNETGKTVESQSNIDDFSAQLRALPDRADDVLGEQWTGQQKLLGYRLSKTPPNGSIPGLKTMDIWIDSATREVHHVDITVQEKGKPEHQMHIQDIRVGAAVDRSLFDLTPPAGYSAFVVPGAKSTTAPAAQAPSMEVPAAISQTAEVAAVVLPMTGSYAQTAAALGTVSDWLDKKGVTPTGPPLGRFWSDQHWEAGYPVPAGTQAEAPLKVVTFPAGLNASAVVGGAWGKDTEARWGAFLKSVVDQGYVPAGPAVEIWSGEDGKPETQSTGMRIPVEKVK
jgi:outer membrane lipoprotein-sorting protein